MSHFTYSLNRTIGAWATRHPEAWIYSWALAGMALGMAMLGGIGFVFGMPFHQTTYGLYAGLGLYAYWFTCNVDVIKASTDAQVQKIKDLNNEVPF